MKFCKFCDGYLAINKSHVYFLTCLECKTDFKLKNSEFKEQFRSKRIDRTVLKEDGEKYAMICEKLCFCGNKQCSYYEMQTRSADEPMTIFYKCNKCNKTWRE